MDDYRTPLSMDHQIFRQPLRIPPPQHSDEVIMYASALAARLPWADWGLIEGILAAQKRSLRAETVMVVSLPDKEPTPAKGNRLIPIDEFQEICAEAWKQEFIMALRLRAGADPDGNKAAGASAGDDQ